MVDLEFQIVYETGIWMQLIQTEGTGANCKPKENVRHLNIQYLVN
jgi:hypothetical protein